MSEECPRCHVPLSWHCLRDERRTNRKCVYLEPFRDAAFELIVKRQAKVKKQEDEET